MAAFVLLHLSDLHFDSAETNEVKRARRTVALGAFLRKLGRLIADEPDLRPSAICLSGDIAYRSARVEYDAAEEWIRQLLGVTGLSPSDLVLAAGNHDINRKTASAVARPLDYREADRLLGVPADDTLTAAFAEFEAFCGRLGATPLRIGNRESYLIGSRTIGSVRFIVLNSAWLARDHQDAGQLWLSYPQLLVLEAEDQMCPVDRDFSTVEIAVFHHPQEYLAEAERYAVENRPATFRHVAARVDLILTGHSHVQDVREPDYIGMRAYHFAGGATFVDNEYHNHVRLFRIDPDARTVQVIALTYDPLNQRWDVAPDRPTYEFMTRERVERIRLSIRETPPVADHAPPVSESDREAAWHRSVDQARDLLRAGKSAAARAILLNVRASTESAAFSDRLRFRIATNLGGAAIELDDFERAVTELRDAAALDRTAESLSNVALALLGAGDVDGALHSAKEAVDLDPKSDGATFVHLKCLAAAGHHDEIDQIVSSLDPAAASFPVALALADVFRAREDYSRGVSWARAAIALNELHPFANMLLAETIVAEVNLADDRDPANLPADVKRRLEDAERAVAVALDVFGADDHSLRRNVALNVRAGIAALRGAFEDCIQYADQVLLSDPQNQIARQNRGLALYQLGRHEDAVAMLASLRDPALQASVALPLADVYLKLDQPQRATDVLTPHFHPERASRQELQAAEVLLDSATRRKAFAEVDALADTITKHWPGDPVASAAIASKEFALGRHKDAIARLQSALKSATGADRATMEIQLARMSHDVGDYEAAIEHFEAAGTVTTATRSADRYVNALYRIGRLDRALELARAIRADRAHAGNVTGIEADILMQQGAVAAAAVLLENICRAEPTNVAHHTRLAVAYARAGRRQDARTVVEGLSLESIKDDSAKLFEVARLRLLLEMPEVVRYAFWARRADFYSAEAHAEYIRLFKAHDVRDEASLAAEVISVGTTAYLRGQNERIVSIFDEGEPLRSTSELHPSSPLAARLLGRRAGDQVVIKQTALEEQIVVIREIVSNYVWAFRESVENFTTWFPDDDFMQMGGSDDASIARLARHLQKEQETFAKLVKAYDNREISLPLFARYAGMRTSDAWRRLWNDPAVIIRAQITTASAALNGEEAIVLDLTALITLSLLDVLPAVLARFRVVVAQLTLDEINEEVLQINIQELSATKVAVAAEDPNKAAALDDARQRRDFFVALRTFVETETERGVSTTVLTLPPAEIKKRERLQGFSTLHSMFVAKERNLPVIMDDAVNRNIAISENISAASALDVLNELRRSGVLTEDQYSEAVEKLRAAQHDMALNFG